MNTIQFTIEIPDDYKAIDEVLQEIGKIPVSSQEAANVVAGIEAGINTAIMERKTKQARLVELNKRMDRLAPACDWHIRNDAACQYDSLLRQACRIETEIGY